MGQLTSRVCIKFDWLAVEFRLNKNLYRQWVKNEQFAQSWGDIIASAPLRECYSNYLGQEANGHLLQFWQDVQNFRILTDYARTVDACRLYRKYIGKDKPFSVPLGAGARAELREALGERCRAKTDELADPIPASVFDKAQARVQEQLVRHVAPFMASTDFTNVSRT